MLIGVVLEAVVEEVVCERPFPRLVAAVSFRCGNYCMSVGEKGRALSSNRLLLIIYSLSISRQLVYGITPS